VAPNDARPHATIIGVALTYVAGTVTRWGRRRRSVPIRFLVDTGTVYTVLPRELLPMRLMLSGVIGKRWSPVPVPS